MLEVVFRRAHRYHRYLRVYLKTALERAVPARSELGSRCGYNLSPRTWFQPDLTFAQDGLDYVLQLNIRGRNSFRRVRFGKCRKSRM